jgi:N-methylhydantoinase A
LHPDEVRHQAVLKKPEPFIPKKLIKGVAERIDCFGKVVVPINREEVKQATRALLNEGVRAIAVAFLWSVENPSHEEEAATIISELSPEIFVNMSHQVAPLLREYGRFNSVMIDTYIGPIMTQWYRRLYERLKEEGFGREMLTAQVWGGVMPYHAMMPIGTINSGPVGGVLASKRMAEILQKPNVITTDVGGTSFDVSVIADYEPLRGREPPIMRYRVNIPMVHISAIGAGGGTVAWVDESRHLRVGPLSAGALPGPVCYGRGGTQPTVTDADLVLGILNPDYYLGGRIRLDREAASGAVTKLGAQIGRDMIETAKAIVDLQNAHMADLLRLVVTRSGHDPRDFALFCYGGGGPTHGAMYGRELGFKEIYMFENSAIWSAFGLASSDIIRIFQRHRYLRMPVDVNSVNETFDELEKEALDEMGKIGFSREEIVLRRKMSMKFGRQVNMETIPVPRKTYAESDMKEICDSFIEYYHSLYGEGAAFVEAGLEIMTFTVDAVRPAILPATPRLELQGEDASAALKGNRTVFLPDLEKFSEINTYEFGKLRPGNAVAGPAIIEAPTTTMFILSGQMGRLDEYRNLKLSESVKGFRD